MSKAFPECMYCGVFFTVGANECDTRWCTRPVVNPTNSHIKVVVEKSIKKYSRRYIAPSMSRWISIVSRAKRKGYEYDVTHEDIIKIIDSPCIYCGSKERIEVDRKDSTLGYTKDNCTPACHRCNTIKNNVVSYAEMMFIAEHLGWRK